MLLIGSNQFQARLRVYTEHTDIFLMYFPSLFFPSLYNYFLKKKTTFLLEVFMNWISNHPSLSLPPTTTSITLTTDTQLPFQPFLTALKVLFFFCIQNVLCFFFNQCTPIQASREMVIAQILEHLCCMSEACVQSSAAHGFLFVARKNF